MGFWLIRPLLLAVWTLQLKLRQCKLSRARPTCPNWKLLIPWNGEEYLLRTHSRWNAAQPGNRRSVSTKSGLPTESTLMEFGTLRRKGWDQTVICRRASSSSHFGNSLHASAGSQCGIRQRLMHHLATPRGQYTCKTFNLIPHFQRNYFICNFADGFAQEIWQIRSVGFPDQQIYHSSLFELWAAVTAYD